MGKFRESVIEEMPSDEQVLYQGVIMSMSLFGNKSRYPFRCFITDKGIWTKGKGFLFIKGKIGFQPFENIGSYTAMKYGFNDCFVFYPKKGKAGTRIFFDIPAEEVINILDRFIPRNTR